MSVASEILRLQNAKAALKTSIEKKGVTVPVNATIDDYAALVDAIPILPLAYTQLAYIESSGTQYLSIPISVSAGDFFGVDMDFMLVSSSFNKNRHLINANVFNQFKSDTYSYDSNTNKMVFSSVIGGTSGGSVSAYLNESANINMTTKELNGTSKPKDIQKDFTSIDLLGPDMYIRIYTAKIYHVSETIPVISLIPAKRNSDNEVGMYDKVSGTFYTNGGTGTFSYGVL